MGREGFVPRRHRHGRCLACDLDRLDCNGPMTSKTCRRRHPSCTLVRAPDLLEASLVLGVIATSAWVNRKRSSEVQPEERDRVARAGSPGPAYRDRKRHFGRFPSPLHWQCVSPVFHVKFR